VVPFNTQVQTGSGFVRRLVGIIVLAPCDRPIFNDLLRVCQTSPLKQSGLIGCNPGLTTGII